MVFKALALISALTITGVYVSCEARKESDKLDIVPDESESPADVGAADPQSQTKPDEPEPKFDLNDALSKSGTIRIDSVIGEENEGGGGGGLLGDGDSE